MDYFNNQILPHLKSPQLYCFCAGLFVATYIGKKILYAYQKKINDGHDDNNKIQKKINIDDTIYFFIHFAFNMYCTYHCWPSVNALIHNPFQLTEVPNTMGFYVPLLHLYHIILCGKKINVDELIHHSWVFVICPLMCIKYINLCDMGMFFMTGLPGGITYLLLFLKNIRMINDITEKHISKHLNMWIRAPGCILTAYFIYLNYANNRFGDISNLNKLGLYLCTAGSYANGIYFASTIIKSHGITEYKNKRETINNNL